MELFSKIVVTLEFLKSLTLSVNHEAKQVAQLKPFFVNMEKARIYFTHKVNIAKYNCVTLDDESSC